MAEVGIFVGTMYGNSLLVAEEAQAILSALGHQAEVFEDPEVKDWEPYTGKYALVVTSTTGQGDLPDSIVPLYEGIKDMYQPHLRYGKTKIIASAKSSTNKNSLLGFPVPHNSTGSFMPVFSDFSLAS